MTAKPDFILIGAQRAASTSLNETLRRHPQVVSPRREVPYFEDPWFNEDYDPLQRIRQRVARNQVWGFKRPSLLGLPECPSRIHAVAPHTKLLVTLREPIQRTISAYNLYVRNRHFPPYPLNVGLRRILGGHDDGQYPWAQQIVTFGLYATHLRSYRRYFSPQSFFVILDDDLRDDPNATLRRVFDFLGVDANMTFAIPSRRNEGIYSPLRIRTHRLAARAIHSRDARGGHMRTRLGWLPRAAASSIRLADQLLLGPLTTNRPEQLDDDVRAQLIQRLGPDVLALEAFLGRSLDPWKASMGWSLR